MTAKAAAITEVAVKWSKPQLVLEVLRLSPLPVPPMSEDTSTVVSLELLLLPLNTSSKDSRPRLAPSPSLLSSPALPKVPPTLGCVRLPLSPQSTQLSELPWLKVPPLPTPLHQPLPVIPLFGAHSLLLSL